MSNLIPKVIPQHPVFPFPPWIVTSDGRFAKCPKCTRIRELRICPTCKEIMCGNCLIEHQITCLRKP